MSEKFTISWNTSDIDPGTIGLVLDGVMSIECGLDRAHDRCDGYSGVHWWLLWRTRCCCSCHE